MASREHDLERGPEIPPTNAEPAVNNPVNSGMVDLAPRVDIPSISAGPVSNQSAMPNFYASRDSTLSPPPQLRPGLSHRSSAMFTDGNSNLDIFRLHLGISDDDSFRPAREVPRTYNGIRAVVTEGVTEYIQDNFTSHPSRANAGRAAPNLGIYQRVIAAETKYAREYKIFAFLINGALGLQIIFAAALTALGAGNGPHGAVTAFGAMNTVIAGFLTFLKGSGLPNRLRYNQNEWSRVREYIEQRERDFALDRSLTYKQVEDEIKKIEKVYEAVRKDIEANTPDNFVSVNNAMKSLRESHPNQDNSSNNKRNSREQDVSGSAVRYNEKLGAIPEIIEHDSQNVQHRISGGLSDTFNNIGKAYHNFGKNVTSTTTEITNQVEDQATGINKQATNTVITLQRSTSDVARQAQHQAADATRQAQNAVSSVQHSAEDAIRQTQSRVQEAEEQANKSVIGLQHTAEDMVRQTQTDAQRAVDGVEHAAHSRFDETRQHATDKIHDAEDRMAMAIRKGVEIGLSMMKHHDHKQQ